MGGLFSKKEKSRITEQDRAVLALKKQRDQVVMSALFMVSVLRIRVILVWIWIRGSVPLRNGSGSGACYFS
jgi:hypothetical protein